MGSTSQDRWQLNNKTTLNLGLRYELYPLMTRQDRGIETVDLDTFDVLLGGVGGNPTDLNIKTSKTLFAPRVGLVYRINDQTVFRTGYGLTYNPLPFSRPLRGFYPLTINGDFVAPSDYQAVTTLAQGIPEVVGPDLSSGRVPLPNSYTMRFPEDDVSRGHIHSWNVAIERRLPWDLSLDTAYVGTAGRDGFADLDINASDTPGGGTASRPFFATRGRAIASQQLGTALEDGLPRAADGAQPALQERAPDQGRLHAVPVEEHDGRRRLGQSAVERAESVRTELRAGRGRPPPRLPDGVRLRTAVQDERSRKSCPEGPLGDWQGQTGSPAHFPERRSPSRPTVPRSTCRATSRPQIR